MNKKKEQDQTKINEQIRYDEVRLTGDNVENGIYKLREARDIAEQKELDLILISPNANPPVCKIADYNKYLYEQKMKKKEQEKKSKDSQAELKELRFRPNTDEHDFNFKCKHAENFLKSGDRLKAFVFFKGREIQHREHGEILLLKLAERLSDVGVAESLPKLESNKMTLFFKPKK